MSAPILPALAAGPPLLNQAYIILLLIPVVLTKVHLYRSSVHFHRSAYSVPVLVDPPNSQCEPSVSVQKVDKYLPPGVADVP